MTTATHPLANTMGTLLCQQQLCTRFGLDDVQFSTSDARPIEPDLEVTDIYRERMLFCKEKRGEEKRQLWCPYMFWRKGQHSWRAAIPVEVKTRRYFAREGFYSIGGWHTEFDNEKMLDHACRLIEQSWWRPHQV